MCEVVKRSRLFPLLLQEVVETFKERNFPLRKTTWIHNRNPFMQLKENERHPGPTQINRIFDAIKDVCGPGSKDLV